MPEATSSIPSNSTVPRRQLGRNLRHLRRLNRLTRQLAAEALEWSEPKLWRIETGQTAMRTHDVETMCRIYGAPEDTTKALMALAKETKSDGWWHAYTDVMPPGFDVYIELEEVASHLALYESEVVHGLFQTKDYATELIATAEIDNSEIELRVNLRLARQALLTRKVRPPQVDVVFNEAIIRRPIGGGEIMAAQLRHLIDVSELPNVSIRVVPFHVGFQYGVVSGPFAMLHFPTGGGPRDTEPPTVYAESLTGVLYLDKPHEIDRYAKAFDAIRKASLDESSSRDLIGAAARGFAR